MPLFRVTRSRSRSDLMAGSGVVKRWRVNIAEHANTLPAELSTVSLSGAVKRDAEPWFDDGNIILVAQDVAFRIYRCLLAAQSTVFADMFASASPSSDECMDGCPVVHVSDPSEDLAHLLRVLLPGSRRLYVSYSLA